MGRPKKIKNVDLETTQLYDEVTKVQTEILATLSLLKKEKLKNSFQCEHLVSDHQCPPYSSSHDYYDLFWKTFLLNEIKKEKIVGFHQELKQLSDSIGFMERRFNKYEKLVSYRNNCAEQSYSQKFQCKFKGCKKAYESEGALELHQKLKHDCSKQRKSKEFNSVFFSEENHREPSSSRFG